MHWNDGRVLVTGGAGFIGSALVWALNLQGFDKILIADRLGRTDKWRNLSPLRFDDYIEADGLLGSLGSLADVSAVFHMGACSSTTETDASFLMRNNTAFSRTLAEWAAGRGIRFLYASSAATYGNREGTLREDVPVAQLRPLNAYAFSKHIFDAWATRSGLLTSATGLRFFNVFGPNEAHKGHMRSMVDRAYGQATTTGTVRLFKSYRAEFADGEQRRDFVYVKDAVAVALHLAARPAYGIFNVGSGCSHTWLELVEAVFGSLGQPAQVEFIDMPEALRARYQYNTCADLSRLRAAGYAEPMTSLASSVRDYVLEYLVPDRRLGDSANEWPPAPSA
jgi:ADP-L-glycero-D-manno-heptose 6-epimerase